MVAALLLAPALQAQGTPEVAGPDGDQPTRVQEAVQDLGEMIVSASRIEESLFETPGSAQRLGEDVLRLEAPSTLSHALRRVPGVMTQKTGPGLGSPFLRGFTGFRTLLLIDGVRLNNSVFRDGPNQYSSTIDPLGLGAIEVVKGPSSVLYGSDAAGGIINSLTPRLDPGLPGSGWQFGGRVYGRYSTAEEGIVNRAAFEASYNGRFAVRIGATAKFFGDLDAGGDLGRQRGLGYEDFAVDAKILTVINENVEVEFLYQRVRLYGVPRAHSTVDGVSFHGTTTGSDLKREFDQDRDLALLTISLQDGRFFESGYLKFGYHSQDELQRRVRSSGRKDLSGFDVDTLILATQFESETAIGQLVYGMDLYYDLVDSFASRRDPVTGVTTARPQGPIGDDSTYFNFGLFIEDRIPLANWGRLTLAARYQHISVDSNEVADPLTGDIFGINESYDAVVGSAKLLVFATDELNLFASASLGFRAPNLSDLTRFSSARSNEIEIPSPGLDEEYFLGFEVGAKYLGRRVSGEIAYFYTRLFDTIDRRPTGQMIDDEVAVIKENVGDGYVQGIEFAVAWNFFEDLTAEAQFAWLEGEADTFATSAPIKSREPLSRIQPIIARVGVTWEPASMPLRIRGEVELVDDQDRLSPRDEGDTQRIPPGGTPGYTIYNLFIDYAVNEDLDLFLNVLNISDKNYRVHGSGSQESGISVVVGFDLRF